MYLSLLHFIVVFIHVSLSLDVIFQKCIFDHIVCALRLCVSAKLLLALLSMMHITVETEFIQHYFPVVLILLQNQNFTYFKAF